MRVVTWNIQRGRPNPDGPGAIDRVGDVLREMDPAVAAIQELDRNRRRSGGVDQPTRLAEATGAEVVFVPTISGADGDYGIGLLTSGSILEWDALHMVGTREPRALLLARIEVDGQTWTVGCTHLSRRSACARDQLRRVLTELERHPLPRVLMGDLNLVPREVLPESTAAGYTLLRGPRTHSTRRRLVTRRIDHILLAGTAAESAAVLRFDVSDHCAVRADLR